MMSTARALHLIASRTSTATIQRCDLLALHRRALSASTGAGDPAVHSGGPPSDDYADRPPKFSGAEESTDEKHASSSPRPAEEPAKEHVPPFAPSGKLGSHEITGATAGASFTQRRRWSSSLPAGRDPLENATPSEDETAARKVREEDREYYRTHKPSPLAEVEFADTRRPITRATDGGAEDRLAAASESSGTMVEDTADASLARAEAMFREAAQRGNPAWPHSRALAAMLARRRREEGDASAGGGAPWSS